MKTLPREPWRGGQICGEQLEYGVVPGRSVFCGEFKKLGSPVCEGHDHEMREDNYGVLPTFAPGNARGLEIKASMWGWTVYDTYGDVVASATERSALEGVYGFTLKWEPYSEDDAPIPATPEETTAWEAS